MAIWTKDLKNIYYTSMQERHLKPLLTFLFVFHIYININLMAKSNPAKGGYLQALSGISEMSKNQTLKQVA